MSGNSEFIQSKKDNVRNEGKDVIEFGIERIAFIKVKTVVCNLYFI